MIAALHLAFLYLILFTARIKYNRLPQIVRALLFPRLALVLEQIY